MKSINLAEKLTQIANHWSPHVVAELNGQHVKIAKLKGEFVWHTHDAEDELFMVLKGRMRMDFRDHHVWLHEGEILVVPRGTEHRPVAPEEVHILLFEPVGTLNTGNIRSELTVENPRQI